MAKLLFGLATFLAIFLADIPPLQAADSLPIVYVANKLEHPAATNEQLLRRHGITPDVAGIKQYLAEVKPCKVKRQEVQELIRQLGDQRYANRVGATRELFAQLSRQPHLIRVELTKALTHPDEEIRHRAAWLLLRVDEVSQQVLLAALQTVERRQLQGLTDEVLLAMPFCDREQLYGAAQAALMTTTCAGDATRLREVIVEEPNTPVRAAAMVALERAVGKVATTDLLPLLKDPNERIRLAASHALINHHPQEILRELELLLDSKDQQIRRTAAALLRAATGQKFGFTPFAPAAERTAAVTRWHQWIERHAAKAKLKLPLDHLTVRQDCVFVCTFNPFRAKEIGMWGATLFTSDIPDSACGCVIRPNGHRVLSDWGSKSIIELDRDGIRVRTHKLPGTPNGLDLLPNGNLLVPLFHEKSLVELSPKGQIVWQIELEGRPTDARRLPTGRTLVALNSDDKIIEINRQGDVTWSIEDIRSPESARRLSNGNTLVAARAGVMEYDPTGREVWSVQEISSPYDAVELDNGHILIGHAGGLREVNRKGDAMREFPLGTVRRIFYY